MNDASSPQPDSRPPTPVVPSRVPSQPWKPPKQSSWGIRVAIALCGVFAVSGAINLLFEDDQTNEEAREELTDEALATGLSASEARCFVDGMDERFDLTGEVSGDPEDNRVVLRSLFECAGVSGEVVDCFVDESVAVLGSQLSPDDFISAVRALDAEARRFLFEVGGRCAGLSSEAVVCVTEKLLARYPEAFEQKALNPDHQAYVTDQVIACGM